MRVDPSDGSRQTLYTLTTGGGLSAYGGASWSPEGIIIFSMHGELLRMMANGGQAQPLGKRAEGETGRYWPQFLPDGRHYLYFSRAARPENGGIYVASLDSSDRKRIAASDSNAAYAPSGHLLFPRGGALLAQAFDVESLELSGEAFRVAERLALFAAVLTGAAYSVSSNGVLAWRTGSTMVRRQLTWFDRSGRTLATLGEPADYSNPALSPDDRRLAVCRTDSGTRTRDLWVFDLVRGGRSKLSPNPADDCNPAWSPDGTRIAFTSDRRGVREIYQTLANGSGEDELLLGSADWAKQVEDWSADGKLLLYDYYQGGGPSDLFLLPLPPDGGRKPVPLLATPAVEDKAQFAPNGRWLAYGSQESGEKEVYVRGVSMEASADRGRWKVSEGGGDEPRWRRDGKELYYLSGSTLMAVDVSTDGVSFDAGVPKPLFEVRLPLEVRRNRFVVTRDGQRFLVNTALEETIEPIQVLVNWLRSKQ
jgi:Tol biopolymer transport system component